VSRWRVLFTRQAQKDARKLASSNLESKAQYLLDVLRKDPLQSPPPFEKLLGDLAGAYSRRINVQHRLVYQILPEEHVVKVIRMWTHYE
jgi:Txe/YoeB family toxin of toxin-antitoxin system